MTDVQGGCACGAVRFALKAKPTVMPTCHCTNCQRLTGSTFALNAWVEKTEVALLPGELASFAFTDAGRAFGSFGSAPLMMQGRPHRTCTS
jgi:hypothetical protein